MRSYVFIFGIMMVAIGPVLVAAAASSCLLTILSGNIFACASVLPVFIGGALFVTGIITCLLGVIMPGPNPQHRPPSGPMAAPEPGQVTLARSAVMSTPTAYSPARSVARHRFDLGFLQSELEKRRLPTGHCERARTLNIDLVEGRSARKNLSVRTEFTYC